MLKRTYFASLTGGVFAALALHAAPAAAAVDCTKDFDMLRGANEQIDRSIADAADDTLVGWDTNDDGMISRSEYMEVCQQQPEEYQSILELPYYRQLQLKGG